MEETLLAMKRHLAIYEATFMSTAIGMVRAGLGVTVLPSAALEVQSAGDLAAQTLVNRTLARKIGILTRRGRPPSPAAAAFVEFLSAGIRELSVLNATVKGAGEGTARTPKP